MSSYHCAACGQKICDSKDVTGQSVILEIPGYTLTGLQLAEETDLSALTHRNDGILPEVWSCCRINVIRRSGGSPVAYADELVEVPTGGSMPPLLDLGGARHLDEAGLEAAIAESALPENSAKLYIIKFTSLWCPPCRALDFVFRAVRRAGDFPELVFCELDGDQEADLCERWLVPSLPYTLFFKNGKRLNITRHYMGAVNGGLSGAVSEAEFRALCRKLLADGA